MEKNCRQKEVSPLQTRTVQDKIIEMKQVAEAKGLKDKGALIP